MENKLTQEDSLELIANMIATAKGNVSQGAFHMLLWGWVIIIISITHFLLIEYQIINHPEMVWLLTLPTLFVSLFVGFKKGSAASVRTSLDYFYMWIWMAFMVTMSMMLFFIYGQWAIISPIVLVLAGFATFLSGKIINFKPMVLGGVSLWGWSLVAYLAGAHYALLIMAAAIFTGYVIPGILLQKRK